MSKFVKEDYENAAKVSLSYAGMCRYLGLSPRGGNYATLKNKIKEFKIDISHFTGKGWNVGLKFKPMRRYKLSDILQKDFPYNTQKLKKRLIKEGIKQYKCEKCGRTEWEGKQIPLELHHINGDRTDNRLENLQLLCPNCHAQTDDYRGKNKIRYEKKDFKSDIEIKKLKEEKIEEEKQNKAKKTKKEKQKRYCKYCGKELKNKQKVFCSQECAHNSVSKRPSLMELTNKMEDFNNNKSAIGRYYGVSCGAVIKWLRFYGIPF